MKTVKNLGVLALFAFSLTGLRLSAQIVQVTPSDMGNWSFTTVDSNYDYCTNGDPGCSTGQFVTGPATPPYGVGSANLQTAPGHGDAAAAFGTTDLNGIALSALTTLSYYTYDTANNGQQFPFLELDISYTGVAGDPTQTPGTDQLFFEPPYQTPSTGGPSVIDQGATQMNTWQSWNALEGGWWDNNGVGGNTGGYDEVASLSYFESYYNNATIVANTLWSNDGLVFKVGEAGADDNFNGYIDGLTVGVNDTNTTYDFDPNPVSTTPEPGTFVLIGGGLIAGVIGKRRLSRRRPAA